VLYTVATMDLIAALSALFILRPMLVQHHTGNRAFARAAEPSVA
jgi:MFS transporter, OFA family, oxalate/formate antiporter